MFLKGYAASEGLLTEPVARKVRHDLIKAIGYLFFYNAEESDAFRTKFALFPDVNDRYQIPEKTPRELSELYRISQSLAACIARNQIRTGVVGSTG